MNNFMVSLRPYWQVSLRPSRAYIWVNLVAWLLLWVATTAAMQSMVEQTAPHNYRQYARIVIDALVSFLPLHFIVRPYLKLVAIPNSKIALEIVPLTMLYLLVSYALMWLSVTMARWDIFGNLDMSQMQVYKNTETGKGLQFVIKDQQLLLVGAINNLVMATGWGVAYWSYHAHAAKKAMQRQMHQAQLQQLTNQLNPHFLFNALNSIRALIFEDQHKAAETVTRLSELFRTHLQAHLKPMSSLADEWQLANQYLAIEQIRFEHRLRVHVELASNCLSQQLPTLTLLTLVENAIKHGVSPNARGGDVTIEARQPSVNRWQLIVRNSVAAPSKDPSTATGLVNIRRRLELHHPQQRLTTERVDNEFIVQLELVYDPNVDR